MCLQRQEHTLLGAELSLAGEMTTALATRASGWEAAHDHKTISAGSLRAQQRYLMLYLITCTETGKGRDSRGCQSTGDTNTRLMIPTGALGCPLLLMFAHAALEVFRHDMMTLAHLPIGASEAYGSSSDCSMARLIQRLRKRERDCSLFAAT